jgi:hypothetical protein
MLFPGITIACANTLVALTTVVSAGEGWTNTWPPAGATISSQQQRIFSEESESRPFMTIFPDRLPRFE